MTKGERVHTISLQPAKPTVVLGDHDVDRVALEFDAASGRLRDFRLELGRGYFIVWLLPIVPGGRLRSILVDCAVAEVDSRVEIDPCAVDYGPEEWEGALGRVGPGRALEVEHVRLELRASPAWYECRARVRHPDGGLSDDVVRHRASK